MIDARSVAVQGFGRGSRFRAVQGLVSTESAVVGGRLRVQVPRDLRRLEALVRDDEFLLMIARRLIDDGVIH